VIEPGARRQVIMVPALAPDAAATSTAPDATAGPDAPWPPPRPEMARHTAVRVEVRRSTWTPTRMVSIAVAAAGAGAIGAGAYFGVHARDLEDRADQRCPMTMCGDPEGLRLNDQAQTSASRANLFYIAGGVTLATAAALWLLGGPGEIAVAPAAGSHQIGVALTGSF
jgi:hypothetical protein